MGRGASKALIRKCKIAMMGNGQAGTVDRFQSDRLKALYVKCWRGNNLETIRTMSKVGVRISERTGENYLANTTVLSHIRAEMDRRIKPHIASKEQLQIWLNAVMRGEIADGVDSVPVRERIDPLDEDYDIKYYPNAQFRTVYAAVPKPPKLADRLKAAELHGKSIMAFVTPVELSGKVELGIGELLDDDLRGVIDITPAAVGAIADSTNGASGNGQDVLLLANGDKVDTHPPARLPGDVVGVTASRTMENFPKNSKKSEMHNADIGNHTDSPNGQQGDIGNHTDSPNGQQGDIAYDRQSDYAMSPDGPVPPPGGKSHNRAVIVGNDPLDSEDVL